MTPLARIAWTVAGFAALAATLAGREKSGWFALVGAGAVFFLAIADSDPVLALGGTALCLARFLPPVPSKTTTAGVSHRSPS